MTRRAERTETRQIQDEPRQIDQAAPDDETTPALAACRAETAVAADQTITVVPAAYFDQLLRSLDQTDQASRLARAASAAHRRGRIISV